MLAVRGEVAGGSVATNAVPRNDVGLAIICGAIASQASH
jgi:hypothetical protein